MAGIPFNGDNCLAHININIKGFYRNVKGKKVWVDSYKRAIKGVTGSKYKKEPRSYGAEPRVSVHTSNNSNRPSQEFIDAYNTYNRLHVITEDGGHDKYHNSKLEAVKFASKIVWDVVNRYPIGKIKDIVRGGKAVVSAYRDKKYSEERSRSNIDEKTGLRLIPDDSNLSDMDNLKRVNPNVNDFNSDSKYNCMLCTTAYEMRRRGYDVTAQREGVGYLEPEVTRWFPEAKIVSIENNMPSSSLSIINNKYADKIMTELLGQPEGSRGNLMLTFAGGGGHSVCYEIENGKLIIRDAQVAKIYKNPMDILRYCQGASYARLDNVNFDPKKIREACYS